MSNRYSVISQYWKSWNESKKKYIKRLLWKVQHAKYLGQTIFMAMDLQSEALAYIIECKDVDFYCEGSTWKQEDIDHIKANALSRNVYSFFYWVQAIFDVVKFRMVSIPMEDNRDLRYKYIPCNISKWDVNGQIIFDGTDELDYKFLNIFNGKFEPDEDEKITE